MKRSVIIALSFLVLAQLGLAQVAPQTISYQGVLRDKTTGDIVADDDYDIIFTLYDASGTNVWSESHSYYDQPMVTVTAGVFSVILGKKTPFSTIMEPPYWLGIKVGSDDEMPRIELTSVIYALHADRSDSSDYAKRAGEVSGISNVFPSSGSVGIGTTNPQTTLHVAQGDWILGSSGHSDLAESALLTSFAGILYEAGGSNWAHHFSAYEGGDIARFGISTGVGKAPDTRVVITKSGYVGIGTMPPATALDVAGTVTATAFAGDGSGLSNLPSSGWSLTGNSISTGDFLGTTNNVALDFNVNNARALRLEPHATSPNVVGGHSENNVTDLVMGATIGGGGRSGYVNQVTANYGTVGGGFKNTASASATVGGGNNNTASGATAAVSGGNNNTASGSGAAVGGGSYNNASDTYATVGGGISNSASYSYTTVGGGRSNIASTYSYATVGGGYLNNASGNAAAVGGGKSNTASDSYATVGGGSGNVADTVFATVSGGDGNTASGNAAAVGGGYSNIASNQYATVGGGNNNTASGYAAAVSGGYHNEASYYYATVSGGGSNTASGNYATVGGGFQNTVSGGSAVVPGGRYNAARGIYSFAAGFNAKANHLGAVVIATNVSGSSTDTIASGGNNQMVLRANGGLYITNSSLPETAPYETGMLINTSSGAYLSTYGKWYATEFVTTSDVRWKKNVHTLSDALDKAMRLRGVSFEWRADARKDGEPPEGTQVGFIAQEVEQVLPEVVHTDSDGYKSVSYSKLTVVLIEAVKELKAEKDALARRVTALETVLADKTGSVTTAALVPPTLGVPATGSPAAAAE